MDKEQMARALEDAGRALLRAVEFYEDTDDETRERANRACERIKMSWDDLAFELLGAGSEIREGSRDFETIR